jgi:hypothetical protein
MTCPSCGGPGSDQGDPRCERCGLDLALGLLRAGKQKHLQGVERAETIARMQARLLVLDALARHVTPVIH